LTYYGVDPPWAGSGRYGRWTRGPELWDGSGYAWTWSPSWFNKSFFYDTLRMSYLIPTQKQLNSELFLINLLKDELPPQPRPKWWRRIRNWFR